MSLMPNGSIFFSSSGAIAFSRACFNLTLKLYSARRADSPSNRGTPLLPSVDAASWCVCENVCHRSLSNNDMARQLA